ncbi:hypothetical protein PMAYCL1PPCAC_12622 [Pristionchus mayeri]|uniref:Uncharacterized protein n=1 Tax=Pristionchus mayeri TaxID=1317129 RepID=A0AAN4ZJG2_9BILA|nr:hypothetical protein PMAYCL1PPCAC_12622 [Pristionchus mayeri]
MATLLAIAGTIPSKEEPHDHSASFVCPLLALEENDGRPMPALPVHCVIESVHKHGFEYTRRCILRACDLPHFQHRNDVLSIHHFEQSARKVNRKLSRATPSQKSKIMAQPFPFVDFRVPGDDDYYSRYREWRMRRTRKNSTGNSSDSESSDESLENLNIRDMVAEDLPSSFEGFQSGTESELDLFDEEEDEVDVLGDVFEDEGEETEREEEEDGSDLSEGEIEYESDVEDEEITVD